MSLKKLCAFVLLIGYSLGAYAGKERSAEQKFISDHIASVYHGIDFKNLDTLDFKVFDNAYRGYLNLRGAGKLNEDKEILTICDFTRSANDFRLWIIDLKNQKILFHTYVAHGQGTGEEFATAFSNRENSHQSSLGFYVTAETYMGEHGLSLKLKGMDNGFNDAAYDRGIVVHGADYVCKKFISENQRLGRSWGCPAVPANMSDAIIATIKDGTCLFVYYPDKRYMKTAYWLNKRLEYAPDNAAFKLQVIPESDPKPAKKELKVLTPEEARKGGFVPLL